jgi:hypothetical protein
MKYLANTLCLAIVALIAVSANAQKTALPKQFLFKSHPASIDLTEAQLNNLFSVKQGDKTKLSLSSGFSIDGPVVSNIKKYSNLQTVAVKLPAFGNMLFSLSKRTGAGNAVVYTGHLFSKDYADGYELNRGSGNVYQLVKIDMEKILPTCNQ